MSQRTTKIASQNHTTKIVNTSERVTKIKCVSHANYTEFAIPIKYSTALAEGLNIAPEQLKGGKILVPK